LQTSIIDSIPPPDMTITIPINPFKMKKLILSLKTSFASTGSSPAQQDDFENAPSRAKDLTMITVDGADVFSHPRTHGLCATCITMPPLSAVKEVAIKYESVAQVKLSAEAGCHLCRVLITEFNLLLPNLDRNIKPLRGNNSSENMPLIIKIDRLMNPQVLFKSDNSILSAGLKYSRRRKAWYLNFQPHRAVYPSCETFFS
jgi:hypothetical protein